MNAMILAAGRGTRLGALGVATAKVLIDIGGRPLLERQLEYLEHNGVRRVVLNTHHQAAQIASFVETYVGSIELLRTTEERLLGTAGGVRNALDHLQPGPFVVLYGDVLIDAALEPILVFHRQTGARATLAVHEAESAHGKGVVEVDDRGRIKKFIEKGVHERAQVLVNSGLYILEADLISTLAPGVESDFGEDFFPAVLERGFPLYATRLSQPAVDIGTPEGLALARANVEDGRACNGL